MKKVVLSSGLILILLGLGMIYLIPNSETHIIEQSYEKRIEKSFEASPISPASLEVLPKQYNYSISTIDLAGKDNPSLMPRPSGWGCSLKGYKWQFSNKLQLWWI